MCDFAQRRPLKTTSRFPIADVHKEMHFAIMKHEFFVLFVTGTVPLERLADEIIAAVAASNALRRREQ